MKNAHNIFHWCTLAVLTVGLFSTAAINNFRAPSLALPGINSMPYMSTDKNALLTPDDYQISDASGNPPQAKFDRYMKPISWKAKLFVITFKNRISIAFACAIIGLVLVVLSPINKTFLTSTLHSMFLAVALMITMFTRWSGYG